MQTIFASVICPTLRLLMPTPDRLSTIVRLSSDYRLLRLFPRFALAADRGLFTFPGPAGLYPGFAGILPAVELWRASERLREAFCTQVVQIPYERVKTALRASEGLIALFLYRPGIRAAYAAGCRALDGLRTAERIPRHIRDPPQIERPGNVSQGR